MSITDLASKTIISDLTKGVKVNGDNYDIQSREIWYILEEKCSLEGINHVLNQRKEGNNAQKKKES